MIPITPEDIQQYNHAIKHYVDRDNRQAERIQHDLWYFVLRTITREDCINPRKLAELAMETAPVSFELVRDSRPAVNW